MPISKKHCLIGGKYQPSLSRYMVSEFNDVVVSGIEI